MVMPMGWLQYELGTENGKWNETKDRTISAPASTAAGNVAGSTEETQTCKNHYYYNKHQP